MWRDGIVEGFWGWGGDWQRSKVTGTHLNGQHNESDADHDDHEELWGPDLRRDVSESHGGERDHAEIQRVEEGEIIPRSFQVLNPTDTEGQREKEKERGRKMKSEAERREGKELRPER